VYKKVAFLIVIVLTIGQIGFSQEAEIETVSEDNNVHVISVGLGPELNMNAPEGFAGGIGLNINYQLPRSLAAGLIISASHDFDETSVLELGAMLRLYLFGAEYSGFFAQADLGTTLIFYDNETTPVFMGGLRAGYRISLGSAFVEPYLRVGYPYLFGVGVIGGIPITIGNKEVKEVEEQP